MGLNATSQYMSVDPYMSPISQNCQHQVQEEADARMAASEAAWRSEAQAKSREMSQQRETFLASVHQVSTVCCVVLVCQCLRTTGYNDQISVNLVVPHTIHLGKACGVPEPYYI